MKIDKRSKMGRFVEAMMPGVVRPLRVLWHEVIGFIFIALAVMFGSSALRNYHTLHVVPGGDREPIVLETSISRTRGYATSLRTRAPPTQPPPARSAVGGADLPPALRAVGGENPGGIRLCTPTMAW